jgi:hypothetical protein
MPLAPVDLELFQLKPTLQPPEHSRLLHKVQ